MTVITALLITTSVFGACMVVAGAALAVISHKDSGYAAEFKKVGIVMMLAGIVAILIFVVLLPKVQNRSLLEGATLLF